VIARSGTHKGKNFIYQVLVEFFKLCMIAGLGGQSDGLYIDTGRHGNTRHYYGTVQLKRYRKLVSYAITPK
jgi:hypothetical protein